MAIWIENAYSFGHFSNKLSVISVPTDFCCYWIWSTDSRGTKKKRAELYIEWIWMCHISSGALPCENRTNVLQETKKTATVQFGGAWIRRWRTYGYPMVWLRIMRSRCDVEGLKNECNIVYLLPWASFSAALVIYFALILVKCACRDGLTAAMQTKCGNSVGKLLARRGQIVILMKLNFN